MQDFTLVIPAHNRPKQLGALLAYLAAQRCQSRILILDSSRLVTRGAHRRAVKAAGLDVQHVKFPSHMPSIDKIRDGVRQVTSEFCGLCADDGLVVLDGVGRCLDALRRDPRACVAQGHAFSFTRRLDGDIDLHGLPGSGPTIDDPTPLGRLLRLSVSGQAATCGIYRTASLVRILDRLKPISSALWRGLLENALMAVEGRMIRVPGFSHGRGGHAGESAATWPAPKYPGYDLPELIAAYRSYRELLARAVLERPDNNLEIAEIRRVLDVIHLRHMIKYVPDGALASMIEQKIARIPFNPPASGTRSYYLHPPFLGPSAAEGPQAAAVADLLHCLDDYPAAVPTLRDRFVRWIRRK